MRALERRLAATEGRYRQLVDAASEAILVADRDGRLVEANEAACGLLGYRRDELIGLRAESLLDGTGRGCDVERLEAGSTVTGFRRLRRRDGGVVEVEGSAKILPDGRFQAILRDVGERRRMEAALRESEQRLRRLTATARAVVYRYRVVPERRLEFVSDEVSALTGYTPEELYADPELVWGHVDRDDRHLVTEPFDRAVVRYTRRDGKQLWFERINLPVLDEHGQLVAVEGVARDVTEQREAELALQAREELFRTLFENALVGIAVVDDDRRYLDANRAACEIKGATHEELLRLRLDDFVDEAEPPELVGDWEELLERGEQTASAMQIVRRDGARRDLDVSMRANVLPGRHVIAMQDVTDRRALAERLRQSERMEAVGRLAGGVAHDFNNLLTVITGYSEVLERRLADESLRREVEEIKRAATRASALTTQLLAYSRRQVLQPRPLDLNGVVRDLENMLTRLIGERIQLVTELDPGLRPVLADAGRLEQVVVNLVVNARDAMRSGGRLTISTANVELAEPLPTPEDTLPAGGYVRLSVADTGVGIPPELIGHIFEPFFTTKEHGRGTGLGLATVYGMARQSGGAILVESEPGAGARFDLYLPYADEPAPPPALERPQPARAGSETVLLVEDDDLVRDLVQEVLGQAGYRVLQARDGDAALEVARSAEQIDLLLTDVIMPTMSGRELASRVASAQPTIKVIYTSGYADPGGADGSEDGGGEFLQKPFTLDALTTKVRDVLDADGGDAA